MHQRQRRVLFARATGSWETHRSRSVEINGDNHIASRSRTLGMSTQKTSPKYDDDYESEALDEADDETPTDTTSPELDPRTKELTTWDESPATTGRQTPKTEFEDEDTISERLVYEGTDEAERERRIAAADEDFEP
jgi:hypothetical protein